MAIAQFNPFKTLCPTVIKKLLPLLLGGLVSIGFLLLWQQPTLNQQIYQFQSFFPVVILIGGLILFWLLVLIAYLIQVEDAAVCGNDSQIAQLVAQLPSELAPLASYLIELADKYQFEQIIRLVQVNSPP